MPRYPTRNTMTFKALAEMILQMTEVEQGKTACAWPPRGCPAVEAVFIVGIDQTAGGDPVLSTGKPPRETVDT